MITRRQFVKIAGALGAGCLLPWRFKLPKAYAHIPGGTLDPTAVLKYQMPLVKPPALKRDGKIRLKGRKNADYCKIAMRQFQQQILPPGLPQTTVWSYGPEDDFRTVAQGGAYFYPAFTLENKFNKPTVIKWVNGLDGLQHLLPVDPTLHWANPIGRRDRRPNPTDDSGYWNHQYIDQDGRYTGPVPMVVHVHGAHTREESDGYPEAWWLPAGANGDVNWTTGTFYDYFQSKYPGMDWGPGYATFEYPNDQPATTLWYHDHTLGMTRVNVYAGPAGFWLIRGGPGDMVLDSRDSTAAILPGPAPGSYPADPFGTYYEIPIVIQDRSFNADGSLFYPDNRAFFEGLDPAQLQIPFTFDQLGINPDPNGWGLGCDGLVSDVAPIWQPEFFGNMMVVNGFTWPFLDVEQRRYRFRLLNGCNSRFLILKFNDTRVDVWQIGAEQGFLNAPIRVNDFPPDGAVDGTAKLLMGPAERADVIVDFTNVPVGTPVTLLNLGPDEPFGGGVPGVDFDPSDPSSTGQVMEFRVGPAMSVDTTTPPMYLQLPAVTPLVPTAVRDVSLNEEESKNILISEVDGNIAYDCGTDVPFGPTAALLGTLDGAGNGDPKLWMDAITENPALNSTEEWTIYNFTADAHPMHVHLVGFQVVDRQALATDAEGVALQPAQLVGSPRLPEAWESGFKDTVIAYPGEVTRIKMKFDLEGFYVWHCHIVEHEDNEMMRPCHVGPIPPGAPAT
jgi:FtsP/CotA-like multicopper oxidase with cupredoxin domain